MANTLKIQRDDTKDGDRRYRVTVVSDNERDQSAIVTGLELDTMLYDADEAADGDGTVDAS